LAQPAGPDEAGERDDALSKISAKLKKRDLVTTMYQDNRRQETTTKKTFRRKDFSALFERKQN
jgi:hypothetical protein